MTELPITEKYAKSLSPSGAPAPGAPEWVGGIDNPFLHGLFAPTIHESEPIELNVVGELPRDLNGAYFRNGPNNRHAPLNRYHWFDGDGMVHAVYFEDGRARYANRWVQTFGYEHESQAGTGVWPGVLGPFDFSLPGGPLKDTANTDLIVWRDRLVALWYESGALTELDPHTLETVGQQDLGGRLNRRISAHSKVDPATGELIFFGYGDRPPYMHYGTVGVDGEMHLTDITLPGPRRPHDIGVTPRYSVLHDFPVFFDPELFAKTGKRIPLFHREVPTRFGVIPRHGVDADVRWFEFEPCYMLHVVNTWEEGNELVMVGCRTADPTLHPDRSDGRLAAMLAGLKLQANLYEWRMNLDTGASSERQLSDSNLEFPMIRDSVLGTRSRYAYLSDIPCEVPPTFEALVKVDLETGKEHRFAYGPGVFGSEAPFAARSGAEDGAEDDGYVMTLVTDTRDWSSACWVFSAAEIEAGPLAKLPLPHRVPAGFHATWMAASA